MSADDGGRAQDEAMRAITLRMRPVDQAVEGVVDAWKARVERAESDLAASRAEVARLREGLAAAADELDRWGWGDFHCGYQPQDRRVVEAVTAARALLDTKESETGSEKE